MTINYENLVNRKIPEVEQQLTKRDTMLFALGVGLGADPCDANQLKFVYEQNLEALPSMAIILGYPGPWHAYGDTGITRTHVVHGEQGFVIHKPLPVEGDDRRADQSRRRARQGQGQGRADIDRKHGARKAKRRDDLHAHLDDVLPRRRRLRRAERTGQAAARDSLYTRPT